MPDSHKESDFLLTFHVQVALLYVIITLVLSETLQIKKKVYMASHYPPLEACAQK